MSKLREIGHRVKRVAGKAVSKTGDLTDTASLHIKLARKEANLADLYEQFGRVAYQKVKAGSSAEPICTEYKTNYEGTKGYPAAITINVQ